MLVESAEHQSQERCLDSVTDLHSDEGIAHRQSHALTLHAVEKIKRRALTQVVRPGLRGLPRLGCHEGHV